jgi:Cellulase (glycosyl hydrolase family 5)
MRLEMRKLAATCAVAVAALAPCSAATANLIVGINDDAGYEASQPTFFMPTMQADGLKMNALTIRWDDTQPTSIDPTVQANINSVIAAAATAGVTVELDLYPLHSQALTDGKKCAPSANPTACGDTARIQQFAAWTAIVARAFPTVHTFIVMNECNQPLFINPQWNTAGQNQSAEVCGRALAAAYDALKAANRANFVWGVGLSPRGNDAPSAPSNSSTSPVRFLGYLGAWFKAFAKTNRRTAPLMDGFDFHPYPVPQSLPFAKGYADPRDASVSNLARIYQAFYNGFAGSPQRTIGQQKRGGLPVSLNEMGIQTDATHQPGYVGVELSANAAGGMVGADASEVYQATYYKQMLALLACDPNVKVINIFHLVDEPNLAGWQSGLYWVGATAPVAKQSAGVVSGWITQTHGACQGKLLSWRPAPLMGPKK